MFSQMGYSQIFTKTQQILAYICICVSCRHMRSFAVIIDNGISLNKGGGVGHPCLCLALLSSA